MGITSRLLFAVTALALLQIPTVLAQDPGQAVFEQTCAACHTVGGGRLVGPDLAGIQNRRPVAWIKSFIKGSQSVIHSGDTYADSLFKAYGEVAMPDHPDLTDVQLDALIVFLSGDASGASATKESVAELPGNSDAGRELFVGNVRFVNHGAACNSCHNVDMPGLMSGGALAKDLTHAITRLSNSGVRGVVTGLPFLQMKETYQKNPLTPQEVSDIVAFLELADRADPQVAAAGAGTYMLMWGGGGFVVLAVVFSLAWFGRKKRTVNTRIFQRQIKSV